MPVYKSRVLYPNLSGAVTQFAVPFPYLDPSHVQLYTIPTGQSFEQGSLLPSSAYSFLSPNLVRVSPALTGVGLDIRRATPTTPLARFASGTLSSAELNLDSTQAAYVEEELEDAAADLAARTYVVPSGDTGDLLPAASARANSIFSWGPAGRFAALTYAALASVIAPAVGAVLGPLYKGDPGGNVQAVGAFDVIRAAGTMVVTSGTYSFRTTSFHTGRTDGAAWYVRDDVLVTPPYAAAHPLSSLLLPDEKGIVHGYKLDLEQHLTYEMIGAVGDVPNVAAALTNAATGTDNLPSWNEAVALGNQQTYGPITFRSPLVWHLGNRGYYHSGLTIAHTGVAFVGVHNGMDSHTLGSFFKYPVNTAGLFIPHWDNLGDNTGGEGCQFERMLFIGSGGTDITKHGVEPRLPCTFRDCGVANFSGIGWYLNGASNASGAGYGFTDTLMFDNCWTRDCYEGIHVEGTDANAIVLISPHVKSAKTVGIIDRSSLGCTYVGPEVNNFGTYQGVGCCWYNGVQYQAIAYRPTVGTSPDTDATEWLAVGTASAASTQYPAWSSTTQYVCGQPIVFEGASNSAAVLGGYTEGGFCCAHLSTAVILGGQTNWTAGSAALYAAEGGMGAGVLSPAGVGGSGKDAGGVQRLSKVGSVGGSLFHHWWIEEAGIRFLLDYLNGDFVLSDGGTGSGSKPPFLITTAASQQGLGQYVLAAGPLGLGDLSGRNFVHHFMGTAAPTSGTFPRGARCYNSAAAAGGVEGWVCVAAGTPGTWKSFGSISA